MKTIKSILFDLLNSLSKMLSYLGLHKTFPQLVGVYGYFFRNLWPYGNVIEVQGSKMYVNSMEDSIVMKATLKEYAVNLVHEKATTDLFKKTVKEGDVFVDLGANVGYFSLLASKIVGKKGKVFSFEPEPKNFSYLKKNLEINDYSQANAFQKAVSSQNGKTKLFVCSYDTGHHTINQYSGIAAYSRGKKSEEKAIEIETVSLDSFLEGKTDRVDVIKMDVEGAEYLALKGMDRILKDNKNIKLFVEFFPLLIEKMGDSPQEFIEKIINDYGFQIYIIPDDYDALTSEMKQLNTVAEVMAYRQKEQDHINLFLKRQ